MKKAALALTAIAGLAILAAGCSKRTAGIPDPVATVNGKAISSEQYFQMLDRAAGQQVLRGLVEQSIILQWADEEKVAPTDEQINKQIEMLKNQGQYDDSVKMMGEAGLRQQMEIKQAAVNLAKKLYKITDADLEAAYNASKAQYVHGPKKQIAVIAEYSKEKIDKDAQALKDGKSFDEVAASNPQAGPNGPITLWIEKDSKQPGIPPALVSAAMATNKGEVSKPVSITSPGGMSQYVIIKVMNDMPKENKSLKDVKDEVESAAAIQKIQMDQSFQQKLNDKKKSAKITINIDGYKNLASSINNPPEPMPMMSAPRMAPNAAPNAAPAKPAKK